MRVLPYFQHTQIHRPAPVGRKKIEPASATQANNMKAAQVTNPAADMFIPSSPVTGVVHSIRSDTETDRRDSGVLKSGNYSFYRLDGMLEGTNQSEQKGEKLDAKG